MSLCLGVPALVFAVAELSFLPLSFHIAHGHNSADFFEVLEDGLPWIDLAVDLGRLIRFRNEYAVLVIFV